MGEAYMVHARQTTAYTVAKITCSSNHTGHCMRHCLVKVAMSYHPWYCKKVAVGYQSYITGLLQGRSQVPVLHLL